MQAPPKLQQTKYAISLRKPAGKPRVFGGLFFFLALPFSYQPGSRQGQKLTALLRLSYLKLPLK